MPPTETDTGDLDLILSVRKALGKLRDPQKAETMRAYMKSSMPFLGVNAGPRRQTCRTVFMEHPLVDQASWMATILTMWHEATHREERYAALDLAGYPRYRHLRTIACMPMYEDLIVDGAWWDYVDELAIRHVGALLSSDQAAIEPVMRDWSVDENIWKRRTAIICQIKRRDGTDETLLGDCILPSLDRNEFFLRKAIGWALRQHSRVNPDWVWLYVREYSERLSALSKKEALRLISPK